MPNLNSKVIAPTSILVPPRQLQMRYSEFATPIYEMSEGLAEQNQKLKAARDLLLPRLMSGEIAV